MSRIKELKRQIKESGDIKDQLHIVDDFNGFHRDPQYSNVPKELTQTLYFITDGEYVKIGISSDARYRLRGLQSSNPRKLTLLYTGKTTEAFAQEQHLHKIYKDDHIRGEWFKLTETIKEHIKILRSYERKYQKNLYKDQAIAS